ncbi:MAG: helix-turn-helix domain-containing protein [Oscillospiraceae bacterium]
MGLERINEYKKEKGLTNKKISELTGISVSSLDKITSGDNTNPKLETVRLICNALGCKLSDLLDNDSPNNEDIKPVEREIIKKYRALDEHGKKIVDFVLNEEYDRSTEQESGEIIQTNCLVLTMYEDAVSAGTGEFLSDGRCVEVTVDETPLTERADFILRVSGDSMEPTYYDGDKVLVENAVELNVGEIGIFILNGQGYIKEYRSEGLFSHNKKYGIIKIGENDRCEIVGRVIGKI